jgi:hypothetical protein
MSSITDALGWVAGAFYVLVALSIVYLFFFRIVPLVFAKTNWDVWSVVRAVLVLAVLAFLLGCVAIFTADWIFGQVLDTLPRTRMAREVDRVTGSLMRLSVDTYAPGPAMANAGAPAYGYLPPPAAEMAPGAAPTPGFIPNGPPQAAPGLPPNTRLKANALDLWATAVQTLYNPSGDITENTQVMAKRDIPQGVTCDTYSVNGGWKLKRYEEWRLECSQDNFRTSVLIQINGTAARGLTGGSYYTQENPFTVYGTGLWPEFCYEPIPAEPTPPASGTPDASEPVGGPLVQSGSSREHRVRAGESLAMIAQQYSLTVSKLVQANQTKYPQLQANPNVIVVGWVLSIPEK